MEKFTKIPVDTFQHMAFNGGVVLDRFDPENPVLQLDAMLFASSGGINFNAQIEYTDWGDDIDNCPKNTKELKRINNRTVTLSGSQVTLTKKGTQMLMAHADINGNKITPRDTVDIENDFHDIWFVMDYSDKNVGSGAGCIAIKLHDALSTGGFQIQSADKNKAQSAFEYTAHYSLDAQDEPPYEIYIKDGTDAPGISLNRTKASVAAGDTITLSATTYPANATVTWDSNDTDVATVSGGVVTGVAAGYAVITASITESNVTYTEICTVTVTPAAA